MIMSSVHERAERLRAERTPFVHARVVLAERPTSANPGDEAIILEDGTIEGFVGGHCAVATVRNQALELLRSGDPILLRITPNPEDNHPGKIVVHNHCLSGGSLEIFMEPIIPAPILQVFGESPIARALQNIGAAMGYRVHDWDGSNLQGVDAVVVASHGNDEELILEHAIKAQVPYVGLIASPKRAAAVKESLDLPDHQRQVLHSPAGLNIGARTPEEIALSIFAEITELRRAPSDAMPSKQVEVTPLTAIDPICKMTVAAVETSIHADVDGERWYFCAPGCKKAFVANPAAFQQA
jgi:xanthine dehydrogenase accessory factor